MDFARWNLGWVFAEIAREHYKLLMDEEPKLNDYNKCAGTEEEEDVWNTYKKSEIRHNMDKCALITIVFSAIALESYIYDYAARHYSDTFVQKYLDKIDTISKWVVIPQLVMGKEFPRGGQAFELLSKLIKERNILVHCKSSDIDFNKLEDDFKKYENRLIHSAKDAIKALDELINEMNTFDPDEPIQGLLYGEKK